MSGLNLDTIYECLAKVSLSKLPITADTDLFLDGHLDSYSILSFIVLLEEKYDLAFDYRDANEENFRTVAKIESLLKEEYGV